MLPAPLPILRRGVSLDPRSFGAKGDGRAKDTSAVQQALDRCAVLGGGDVVLADGIFRVGTLRIGSNTTLRIEQGAVLKGSDDIADYPVIQVRWEGRWVSGHAALLWSQEARNVQLTGGGRIVGSTGFAGRIAPSGLRHPALMEFVEVIGLAVSDLSTEQGDMWSIHPVYCQDVRFSRLAVRGGADGIDVDSCRRVLIEDCRFDTADDCISLKSGRGMEGATIARPAEDVTIRDCSFSDRRWACIGIGSETSGGIRNVLIERCRFLNAYTFSIYIKSRPGRGAFIENITMRDLEVAEAGQGFLRLNFLDSGKQDQFPVSGIEGIPRVGGFTFERVAVRNVPVLVDAVNIHPDKPLTGFTLRDIHGASRRGIALANMQGVVLEGIHVDVKSGPMLTVTDVTGSGLEGAAKGIPVQRPPHVEASAPFRLGEGLAPPN
ncbi:glycosyl hydrolase family 28 protein [Novosphingobium sp.]|uniref:glycoside hydrolase family 28 protein n=1 Tax=Novosphingobium sp. TaxID=1874826 RepID=UPI0031CFE67A